MSSTRTLGRYQLLERLAAGGMGEVFLAVQQTGVAAVERLCVVKTVHPDLVDNPMAITRFVDEAGTSLLLAHPHLCVTFDVARVDDALLIAMEYIDGVTLRQIQGRLDVGEALDVDCAFAVARGVLLGLEYAHNLKNVRTGESWGLVHRDISPQNIMISLQGDVKVIDFGVARSRFQSTNTGAGAFVGKLRYMAPEQLGGRRCDRRTDVFSVGVVVAELLSGQRFYGDEPDPAVMLHLMTESGFQSPTLRALPDGLAAVVARAVERDPKARYGSAQAFLDALQAVVSISEAEGRRALRRRILSVWPDADDEEAAFLRGAFGSAPSRGRSFEDETLRVPPQANVTARSRPRNAAVIDDEATPDAATVRRPFRGAARRDADDIDADATERLDIGALAAQAGRGAPTRATPRLVSESGPASERGPPQSRVSLVDSSDGGAGVSLGSGSLGDDDDDEGETTMRWSTPPPVAPIDAGAPRRRAVPIQEAKLHPADDGEDRTARSLPNADTPSSGTGVGDVEVADVVRFRAARSRPLPSSAADAIADPDGGDDDDDETQRR